MPFEVGFPTGFFAMLSTKWSMTGFSTTLTRESSFSTALISELGTIIEFSGYGIPSLALRLEVASIYKLSRVVVQPLAK